MSTKFILGKLHLWLGLASGTVLFIVCLTGSIYTFRTQIENAFNYNKIYVENQGNHRVSLDTIVDKLKSKGITVSQIIQYEKANRSIEIFYSSTNQKESGTYFVNPYTGAIIGKRNTILSPFFEIILNLHKSLLLNKAGKHIVGISVIIFVFMLISGIILWIPAKLDKITKSLKLPWKKSKPARLIDLHKIPGVYSLILLLLISVMGLYISYPWVKSTIIVSLGGSPVLSEATDKQKEKIKNELAGSFAASLQKIIANNSESSTETKVQIQNILNKTDSILPYKGIITISLPNNESSLIKIKKINRENTLRALLPDELEFNKSGELSQINLFKNKSPDQKLITISLPLHTGEILGWPSLILYFIVSLTGASLPVTGTYIWYKRKKNQFAYKKGIKNVDNSSSSSIKIDTKNWLIVYASKSGNSKLVALNLKEQFKKTGLDVKCLSASQINTDLLETIEYLFIIISTHGNGVPPPSAKKLFEFLKQSTNTPLTNLNFSICALGDSSYEHFCKAGKDLDQILKKNQAKEFIKRVDCDYDFSLSSSQWISANINNILNSNNIKGCDRNIENMSEKANLSRVNLTETQPKKIRVDRVYKLTKNTNNKPCYHIILKSEEKLDYIKPGDTIEINPKNPEWLIYDICDALNIKKNKDVIYKLTYEFEITSIVKTTLEKFQVYAKNKSINDLLNNPIELRHFLAKANFYDLIADFPAKISWNNLKKILPRKKGRLYSLASSTNLFKNEIHLTVKSIRYNFNSRKHEGAGSIELTNNIKPNDYIEFRHYPNLEFRLPENKTIPIVLIGIGTGIAPYRAFLQEKMFNNDKRKIWMIWGDKNEQNDFLYKDELFKYISNGILNKLNTAFSRDGKEKIYVQDIIMQNETEFLNWINKGSHIYVCGSIKMAEGIREVIKNILKKQNKSGITYTDLIYQQRYHEDAY